MLHILFGPDDFSLREALEEIKNGLGDGELLTSNTTVLEGKQVTPDQLTTICDTIPFLAQKRLVIVEGLLTRFEPRGKGTRQKRTPSTPEFASWQALKGYIAKMPPTTVLILIDGKLSRNNPLLKHLIPEAQVREFSLPRSTRLQHWLSLRVKESGGDITPPAGRLLADLVGPDLWTLASEIEKLCLYTKGRSIEERDIRLIVTQAREANIFSLVDAIMQGNTSVAAQALHQLLDEGAAAPYLLFMITRQFRMLVQAKELSSQGRPSTEVANRLGLVSDYALEKTMEQARHYSMPQLEEVYRKLLDTDISIKTGRYSDELALDLLIVELCRRGDR